MKIFHISYCTIINSSNYYWGFTLNADVKSSDTYQSYIMLPHKHNNYDLVRQQNMITGGKRSLSRSLYMGHPVWIINFSKHAKDKWLAGVVTDYHGPFTYLITLDDGRIFRRHLDHIRLRTNCMTTLGHHTLLWQFKMLLFQKLITIL